ncbi:hypothetical protein C7441_11076 [Pseudaminobacter salicylatoxidans]|uniref:Uncharacterized protein n=1 Tax=Pseudaminobacter salicylatoxidans TaxID=93369 RepID=A0A316C1Y8_PSESE|nr:hypothetical protein [Pseudaminobacter salicylatoxidans]PWJ81544.1 hypothetical protein C7441_11076 [Pseudaminobacter salicylatoxidans]
MNDRGDPEDICAEDYELESFRTDSGASIIHLWLIVFGILLVLCVTIFWFMTASEAHDATAERSYAIECCPNRDCGQVPADWISGGPDGVRIIPTGEVIPYSDTRIKQSPDGQIHWCRPPEVPSPRTICIYLPLGGA